MKIRRYGLLCAAIVASVLSGCGKKEVDDSDQIASDFVSVQGTMTDAPGEKAVDEFSVPISNGVINVKIDVGEIDDRVSRIYPATRLTVDEQYIDSIAAKLFDNGVYEVMETGSGNDSDVEEDVADSETNDIVGSGELTGTVNGDIYSVSYSNSFTKTESGPIDNGFYIFISKYDEDKGDLMFDYGRAREEDCTGNTCEHDDALAVAETFLSRIGFDDYVLSEEYPLIDLAINGMMQGCGYNFTFCKEIDGTFGRCYSNDCYYQENGDGATFFEYIDVYVTAEDGITGVNIKNMYEMDYSGVNTDVVLLGVDEAMTVAKDKITQMLLTADEAGSSLAERTQMDVSMELSYVPLRYGDDIAYMPVYLFIVDLNTDEFEKNVLMGVSAVDGQIVLCNYFYDSELTFFTPAVG